MKIISEFPLLEEIFDRWSGELNRDYKGYKNHVYRMINFTLAQGDFGAEDAKKIVIAGCFHDLGIWSDRTFAYLPPSIRRAKEYLRENELAAWSPGICCMIDNHHKLTSYKGDEPLTEAFRRGDLVDFSLGIFKCGLPKTYINDVKAQFPNEGFHKRLLQIGRKWVAKHPLNPVPVLKW